MREPSVYLIGADDGPIKIGYGTHPRDRLTSIQSGHLRRLTILFQLQHAQARTVEARVHRALARYRISGEWFDVQKEVAIAAIMLAAGDIDAEPSRPRSDTQNWQIKNFPVEMRQAIIKQAANQHVTVAEWLHAYFGKHPMRGANTGRTPESRDSADESGAAA